MRPVSWNEPYIYAIRCVEFIFGTHFAHTVHHKPQIGHRWEIRNSKIWPVNFRICSQICCSSMTPESQILATEATRYVKNRILHTQIVLNWQVTRIPFVKMTPPTRKNKMHEAHFDGAFIPTRPTASSTILLRTIVTLWRRLPCNITHTAFSRWNGCAS